MKQFIEKRFPLELPHGFLQLFAEGGDGGGNNGGDPGGDGGNGGNGGNGGGNLGGKGDKTFTQAEVDTIVQNRLARADTALAKRLGFESVEALEAALKKPAGNQSSNKKDDNGSIDVEEIVKQQLEEQLNEQNKRTFQRLLTAEVKVVANELGFADWEDALKLADLSGAKENDKGEIEGVREALEKLAKDKPHLLRMKQGSGRFGANINNNPQDDRSKRLQQIADMAKNRGNVQANVNDPWKKK